MKILIACEFSGRVRDEFLRLGHYAVSCDLLPSESNYGRHEQRNVLEILDREWDMMIAFPPCQYLCNSGVRWLYEQRDRWQKMEHSARFFKKLLNAPIKKKALENSRMHKYAIQIIGRKQDKVIQPWQFGHGETKATCLWLENLPPLQPTMIVTGREPRVHYAAPGPDRWKERSRTLPGIAAAMAQQWG